LAAPGTPADLARTLTREAGVQIERLILIEAVGAAIQALLANDYPLPPPVNALRPSLLAEMQEMQSAIAEAAALFVTAK
jgi:hypothetical protein